MTNVNKSRVVPYTCQDMYVLVNDIESYAEFLPHFVNSQVHYRDQDTVEATLTIHAAGMEKSFTTRNNLQENKMIEMRLVNGPFSHFEGFWRFDQHEHGCHIAFDLEFEFSSHWISMLIGPMFEKISETMVDAFCERAKVVYS